MKNNLDVEKNRCLDEMAKVELDMRSALRGMSLNGADPAVLDAIFSSHLNIADDIAASEDAEESFIQPLQYFAKQVVEAQSKYRSNLDFAVERAGKMTKEALMKEYFKHNSKCPIDAEKYSELVDLSISECVGMYTPAGAFGEFIEKVMRAVSGVQNNGGELVDILEKLNFMLDFKWRSDPGWRKQEYMGIEFGLGYLLGLVTPAITGADNWGSIEHLYPKIKAEINSTLQSQRGGKKGAVWTVGLKQWVQEKIKGMPTKNTKTGLALKPSNRAFATSIRSEAMNYRYTTYGSKWTNEQTAFEWIQKAIKNILNS